MVSDVQAPVEGVEAVAAVEAVEERVYLDLSVEEFTLIYMLAFRGLSGSNNLRMEFERDLDAAASKLSNEALNLIGRCKRDSQQGRDYVSQFVQSNFRGYRGFRRRDA